MTTTRLVSTERRHAIADAALPLFARKGFAATTVKEIAAAAGVSEALIFKHFPSKAALYEAILTSCFDGDEELAAMTARPPGSDTLVELVQGLVEHFIQSVPQDAGDHARHRLLVLSQLDDGEFARVVYRWLQAEILPLFTASIAAAERAGDLAPSPIPAEARFWFALHMGEGIATQCLTGGGFADYACGEAGTVTHAARFLLRGFGMTDAALDRLLPAAGGPPETILTEPGAAPGGECP